MAKQIKARRLYVGNLFSEITEEELKAKFQKFGSVVSIEIKHKKDIDGAILSTFAFLSLEADDDGLALCFQMLANTRWHAKNLILQLAKESFLSRLQKERQDSNVTQQQDPQSNAIQSRPTAPSNLTKKYDAKSEQESSSDSASDSDDSDSTPKPTIKSKLLPFSGISELVMGNEMKGLTKEETSEKKRQLAFQKHCERIDHQKATIRNALAQGHTNKKMKFNEGDNSEDDDICGDRFKLDERFNDGVYNEGNERDKQFQILGDIMGHKITPVDTSRQFKPMERYDPTKDKTAEVTGSKQDDKSPVKSYEIRQDLKERFSVGGQFSFFKSFGSGDQEEQTESVSHPSPSKTTLFPVSTQVNHSVEKKKTPKPTLLGRKTFFLKENDPRLQEAEDFFLNGFDKIEQSFEEYRSNLRQIINTKIKKNTKKLNPKIRLGSLKHRRK